MPDCTFPTSPEPTARARIEVACFQCFLRHLRKGVRIFDQPLPNAVASLGSFLVEQPSIFAFANQFHHDFLLLNLK